jgi:hypothetical protein
MTADHFLHKVQVALPSGMWHGRDLPTDLDSIVVCDSGQSGLIKHNSQGLVRACPK